MNRERFACRGSGLGVRGSGEFTERTAAYSARGPVLAMLCVVALAAASSGCGYALAGRGSFLPAYIRTIGLPTFVNHTQVFEIERPITDRVRSELIGRGSYTVTPETTGVDAVLTGEISSITVVPAAFTEQQQASRYVLIMTSKVEFKDLKTGKILWSNPAMQFREEYEVATTATPDVNTFLGQDANAVERLATEFARSLVSSILEAF
jgi:outer membrane lipopolysaccharide assembly protein LptE/RlpB